MTYILLICLIRSNLHLFFLFLEMAPLAYLLVLMSVAQGIGFTNADDFHYRIMKKDNCDYKGYAPDGYEHEITSISPITVEAPANALAKIAGIGAGGKMGLVR